MGGTLVGGRGQASFHFKSYFCRSFQALVAFYFVPINSFSPPLGSCFDYYENWEFVTRPRFCQHGFSINYPALEDSNAFENIISIKFKDTVHVVILNSSKF
ncbi:hypothetical protein PIB30_048268 [Stylosanthes scabra]|uniref:Uncharacterized protein n=1 Tax=Stylosanthes scabra TaxID=79078 RepID=A0ABU6RHS8_9FABA|nr:hypothetical protein [Stylosanthes scabra]